jgi:hypothetical protein
MALRCIWSGEVNEKAKSLDIDLEHKGQKLELFALPEHHAKTQAFLHTYQKHRLLFQRLMAMGLILVVLATFSSGRWIESVGWGILGITFLMFPFGHRPDFQGLCLRKSIRLARVLGVAFLGMAVFVTLMLFR